MLSKWFKSLSFIAFVVFLTFLFSRTEKAATPPLMPGVQVPAAPTIRARVQAAPSVPVETQKTESTEPVVEKNGEAAEAMSSETVGAETEGSAVEAPAEEKAAEPTSGGSVEDWL